MKILTLNTHSLVEENYNKKLNVFIEAICKIKPDIIIMQEVNQSAQEVVVTNCNYLVPDKNTVPLKADNHAYKIYETLKKNNISYYFTWAGVKLAWGKYDEGLAVMSLMPLESAEIIELCKNNAYNNWKTRKALLVKCNGMYICNTHFGWWNDTDEPFLNQWKKLNKTLLNKFRVFLAGDFNSPADERHTGYDTVTGDGWYDTYTHALFKDDGYTVTKQIDGWRNAEKKRIDYIFTNFEPCVKSSYTIFNGKNEQIVSDHNGIIITV